MWKNYTKVVVLYNERGKVINLYINEECDNPIVNMTWIPYKTYILNTNDVRYLRMTEMSPYMQGLDYLIRDKYEVVDVY